MTLYQRILEVLRKQQMTFAKLVDVLKAKRPSVKSALRDLVKYGYVSASGQRCGYIYGVTEKADGFKSLLKEETGRVQIRKPVTTVQYAQTRIANSVFNLAQF